ncbi:MAG: winged helix-turn-helix transcriptional regulator, partial [Patescibacteria group bacterium]|nr:winged helix-turn-helix transcriptional regulator [Patescibacteria group bacterium]
LYYIFMSNKDKIIDLIQKNEQQTIKQLSDTLDISLSMVHRHVKELVSTDILQKIGSAPHVFYILADQKQKNDIVLADDIQKIIDDNFLFISPRGQRSNGVDGFALWCQNRGFDPVKKADEYVQIYTKYDVLKRDNVISGRTKIVETFGEKTCLEDVFYADFYAWEIFGKTKLGQLLLYAKQSQDKKMMKEVTKEIEEIVQKLIQKKKIDAIGFIPPTVKRQVQFMKILQEQLHIALPILNIVKVHTDIITPQKTLSKLQDRIENANHTIFVTENNQYKNVLLIDDAVGSGATLNQVACKIKRNKIGKSVYGFAITGSVKGFDTISEV